MHPVERLRWVNQARGIDHRELVAEVVSSLASLRFRADEMIPVVRSALDRHPSVGPLWSGAARVLGAVDVRGEASAVIEELFGDRTDDAFLASSAAEEVVAFTADAAGPDGFLAPAGVLASVRGAAGAGVGVWALAPVGAVLPELLWREAVTRSLEEGRRERLLPTEVIPTELVARVVRESGPAPTVGVLNRPDCAHAPELLRRHDSPGSWRPSDGGRPPLRS